MNLTAFLSSLPANVLANFSGMGVDEPSKRIEVLLKIEPLVCRNISYEEAVRQKNEEIQLLAKELGAPLEWNGYKIIYGSTDCCVLAENKKQEVYDMRNKATYAGLCLVDYASTYMECSTFKGTTGQRITLELINWLTPGGSCAFVLNGVPEEWELSALLRDISGSFEEGFKDTENLITLVNILQFGLSQEFRDRFQQILAECSSKYARVKDIIDALCDEEETVTTPSDWEKVLIAKELVISMFAELFVEHKTEILELIRKVASDPINVPFEMKLNPEYVTA